MRVDIITLSKFMEIINRKKLYGEKFSNKKILISVIEKFDLIVIVSGGAT